MGHLCKEANTVGCVDCEVAFLGSQVLLLVEWHIVLKSSRLVWEMSQIARSSIVSKQQNSLIHSYFYQSVLHFWNVERENKFVNSISHYIYFCFFIKPIKYFWKLCQMDWHFHFSLIDLLIFVALARVTFSSM